MSVQLNQEYNRPFILFVFVLLIGFILPDLIQDGMFMDGMIYATVAKNLANNHGTFWDLHLCKTLSDHYRHQPPLTIWITSMFFKLMGNSMYVERVYSFLTSIIAIVMMGSVWRNFYYRENDKRLMWWFSGMLFIITPIVSWAFRNNMEENTMVLFILGSLFFNIKAFVQKKAVMLNSILSGLFVFLAMMSKGVQGMFIIVFPLLYCVLYDYKKVRHYLYYFFISLAVVLFCCFLMYLYEPAREYFIGYYNARLVSTFTDPGVVNTDSHFYLLYRLFSELVVMILFSLIIFFAVRLILKQANLISKSNFRDFVFFILLGLAGTIPLLVTREQRGFYLVASLPFYALGFAALITTPMMHVISRMNISRNKFMIFNSAALLLIIILSINNFGKIRRHESMLQDVYTVGKIVTDDSELYISDDQERNWSLYIYFKRYYNIDVVFNNTPDVTTPYHLISKTDKGFNPNGFTLITDKLNDYRLYKRL